MRTAQSFDIGTPFPARLVPCKPLDSPSYDQVVAIEPLIDRLIYEAKKLRKERRASWAEYEPMKAQLARLVGWYAPNPLLRSCAAFNVAVSRLIAALGV